MLAARRTKAADVDRARTPGGDQVDTLAPISGLQVDVPREGVTRSHRQHAHGRLALCPVPHPAVDHLEERAVTARGGQTVIGGEILCSNERRAVSTCPGLAYLQIDVGVREGAFHLGQ